jgi:hypothetical protein
MATEMYRACISLPSKGIDPWFKPTPVVERTPPIANIPSTSSIPVASGSRTEEATIRDSNPMQPFVLDESVLDLASHECYWVTWVAVRPGVFFGM